MKYRHGGTESMSGVAELDVMKTIFSEYGLGEEIVLFYKKEISEAETDFLFIVPRKCMTGYKALVNEGSIESVFSRQKRYGMGRCGIRYGTPQSFILYIDEIRQMLAEDREFVITVIDDIIVYGRGICRFLDNFLNYFSEPDKTRVRSRIQVRAFIRNAEIPFLQKQYPDICESDVRLVTYKTYGEPFALRRISDLFLNSFALTMTPNTSFVNSWVIREDKAGELYCWLHEKLVQEKDRIYQEYVSRLNNYQINVFECPEKECFGDIVEFACIRCYTSGLPRITLIPYVFLKPLTGEEIDEIYRKLSDSSYKVLVSGFRERTGSLDTEGAYVLKLEYLIRMLSEIYGCCFLKEFQNGRSDIVWSNLIEEDTDAIRFSYLDTYYSVDDLFSAFEEYKYSAETVVPAENVGEGFADEERAMDEFKKSCFYEQEADECSYIDDYFSFNSDFDDKGASGGKERLKGITSGYLKKKLKEQIAVKDLSFYGHLSCCMDSGKAALTISCLGDYYVSVLKSGEQAYRLLTETNQWAIKYLSKIEETFTNLCLQDLTVRYMKKYIKALQDKQCIDGEDVKRLNYLSDAVEDSRKKYFDEISCRSNVSQHKMHRARMRDYYVERVEETPVPAYEERLKEVYASVMTFS